MCELLARIVAVTLADPSRRVEQDLAALPVAVLGDVEVMINAIGLQMADAGAGDSRARLRRPAWLPGDLMAIFFQAG